MNSIHCKKRKGENNNGSKLYIYPAIWHQG